LKISRFEIGLEEKKLVIPIFLPPSICNANKFYFYPAIVVNYAEAVANSTRGPGRNLSKLESLLRASGGVSGEVWGADGNGPAGFLFVFFLIIRAKYAEIGRTKAGAFHSRRLLPLLPSCLVWNRGGTPRDRGGLLPTGLGGRSVRPCVPWSQLRELELI
jgi:hypothetical protein